MFLGQREAEADPFPPTTPDVTNHAQQANPMVLTRIGFPCCRPQGEAMASLELKRETGHDNLRGRTAKLACCWHGLAPGKQLAAIYGSATARRAGH